MSDSCPTRKTNPNKTMRPASAKALIINAFALAGRFVIFNPYTQ